MMTRKNEDDDHPEEEEKGITRRMIKESIHKNWGVGGESPWPWRTLTELQQDTPSTLATIYTHYTPSWTYLNPACDGRILVWQQGQLLMVLDGRNPTKMLKPVATWRSRLKMLKHVQHDKEDFPFLAYMYHVHKCTYLYTFHSSRYAISFLGLMEGWNKTKEVPEEAQPSSASKYLP